MHHARFLSLAFLVGIVGSAGCRTNGEPNINERRESGLVPPPSDAQPMRRDSGAAVWQRLDVGSYDGMATRQRLVVRDGATWAALWQQLASNHRPIPAVPAVDFAGNVVIVAAMGTRSSGGYSIDIDDVRMGGGDARISVTERSPGDGCMVTMALTAPVAAVVVPRFLGQATFLERTEQRACR